MPERRPVLHQPVVEEHPLPGAYVAAAEERPPARIDYLCGYRRTRHIRPVGEQPEHEEAAQDHEQHRLDPDPRDQKLAPPRTLHRRHFILLVEALRDTR